MNTRPCLCALTAVALAAGCKKAPEPAPAPPAPVHAAAAVHAPAAESSSAAVASQPGRSDRECVGAIEIGVPREVTLGGRKAELNGYKLVFHDKSPEAEARFGVVASINEDTPENLFNLKRYIAWFKAQRTQAIIVDGDTGESEPSIERSLAMLAETGLPVYAIIGNRECKGDYNDAMVALQKKFSNVIDLGRVRYVDDTVVDLVGLPGYHDPNFVHCATGCIYTKGDVDELKKVAQAANSPVILVAHGPPHGTTSAAIDAISEGGKNVGDPGLNGLIAGGKIAFGIFGNIKEAGGRATDLSGQSLIKEGAWASALYLNPGAADSVPWPMNDGTTSAGMAALISVKDGQASYQIYRAKKLTAAERADAARQFPKPTLAADVAAGSPVAK